MSEVFLDLKVLNDFIATLDGKLPVVKVGILGTSKMSVRSTAANATIGMKHEFGKEGMPVRSFLRIPVTENLQSYMDKKGAFSEEVLKETVRTKSLVAWMKNVGFTCEEIISDAFNTGGFGKWKPSNMFFKKNHQTLVETQQLRNSILSEVQE